MTFWTLIRRSLRFHARAHLGVVLGAAIGSAALIGALAVGDSVKATLRDRAISRLGPTWYALNSGDHFFQPDLADRVGTEKSGATRYGTRASALVLPGTAARPDGLARANHVVVIGADASAWAHLARWLIAGTTNGLSERDIDQWQKGETVLLNETLVRQLGVAKNDEVVIRVRQPTALAQDAVLSPRDAQTIALRLKVGPVLGPGRLGDFSLSVAPAPPANAFVSLDSLGRKLELAGRANLLANTVVESARPLTRWDRARANLNRWLGNHSQLQRFLPRFLRQGPELARPAAAAVALRWLEDALDQTWRLEDAQLSVHPVPASPPASGEPVPTSIELTSSRIFLESGVAAAARQPRMQLLTNHYGFESDNAQDLAFARFVTNGFGVLTYLANLIRAGSRATPYSMVTATDGPLVPVDLRDDEILVNQWLADDLQVKRGDSLELSYFVADSGSRLAERTNAFRVRAIVPLEGGYADRTLMPDFPGIAKAESTHDWDTGFPLVYKIRAQDEAYWKQYRGTPKAFVTLAAGQAMWANRFGALTAVRYPVPANGLAIVYREAVYRNLLANLNPSALGLRFEAVRDLALQAAAQSQDFGQLFLGFSLFLVVAALLLMALLFQFGVEQRVQEIGTLLALGFSPKKVRRLFLAEGIALALLGGVVGALGGLGYARAMLWGLTTVWRGAVGGVELQFHATTASLVLGACASTLLAGLTIWLALRRQARQPVAALLAGQAEISNLKFQISDPSAPGRASRALISNLRFQISNGWLALAACVAAAGIVLWELAAGDTANAGAFFSAGALLLVGGLGLAAASLRALETGTPCQPAVPENISFGPQTGPLAAETQRRGSTAQSCWPVKPQSREERREGKRSQSPRSSSLCGFFPLRTGLRVSGQARLTLGALTVRACARRRQRSLATIALLACGSFVVAAIGVFRLDAQLDAARRTSGTGGFALVGESTLPIIQDLNTGAGREVFGLNPADLAGVQVVPFRVRDGDEASCLNLNRAQKPRLLGVKPELLAGRFLFTQAARGLDRRKGWSLLQAPEPAETAPSQSKTKIQNSKIPNEVPAIGDANAIEWALGKKLGDTLDYTDEHGRTFKVRLVGAVANSILQGSLIIDEAEFVRHFPSESGYRAFLLDAPSNAVSQVSATLAQALQNAGLELTPTVQKLNAFNAVQNTYLGTFQVLGGLGLLLGSAGLGVVVLRNVLERRGELGLLLALGFRRRVLHRLVLAEHAALLATGLALGLAAAAIAVLPALLSPGTQLPYASLALTLAAVVLNGAAWTWLATRYALRGNLMAALRNE